MCKRLKEPLFVKQNDHTFFRGAGAGVGLGENAVELGVEDCNSVFDPPSVFSSAIHLTLNPTRFSNRGMNLEGRLIRVVPEPLARQRTGLARRACICIDAIVNATYPWSIEQRVQEYEPQNVYDYDACKSLRLYLVRNYWLMLVYL